MRKPFGFYLLIIGLIGIMFKNFFVKTREKNNSRFEDIIHDGLHTSQDVTSGVTVELWRFLVPPKAKLTITHFANYINIPDAWGLVTWRFKRNGVGLYPYSDIEDQLGYASQLAALDRVECNGGDLFVVEATNNYADEVKVGIVLKYILRGKT